MAGRSRTITSIFMVHNMSESASCQKLRKGIRAIRLELEEMANAIAHDRVCDLTADRALHIMIKPANDFFDEMTQADCLPDDEDVHGKVLLLITDLGYASTIVLQQKLDITYRQAVKIVADLERQGLVEPAHGFRPHKVLPAAYAARECLEISLEKQKAREYSRESLTVS
jgi:DNA segregation ATPase FtsK/SpoIIIE-like protein